MGCTPTIKSNQNQNAQAIKNPNAGPNSSVKDPITIQTSETVR